MVEFCDAADVLKFMFLYINLLNNLVENCGSKEGMHREYFVEWC